MKKIIEFAKHAKECRALAAQSKSEAHRKQLLAMADSWDQLAAERSRTRTVDKAKTATAKH
jgi:hypothetical protein